MVFFSYEANFVSCGNILLPKKATKTEAILVSENIFASEIIRYHPVLVPISGPLSLSKSIFEILTSCTTLI